MRVLSVVVTVFAAWFVGLEPIRSLGHALAVTFPVALGCAIGVLPVTVYARAFRKSLGRWLVWASVAFVLIPTPAIAQILADWTVPYSRTAFVATLICASVPLVVVTQYVTFDVCPTALLVARHTPTSLLSALRAGYPGALRRAVITSSVVTSVFTAFDPGIALVAGTTQPAFGRIMIDSMSYYAPTRAPFILIVLCALVSMWMVAVVRKPSFSASTAFSAGGRPWHLPAPRVLTVVAHGTALAVLAGFVFLGGSVLVGGARAGSPALGSEAVNALASSLFLTTCSLVLASVFATWPFWLDVPISSRMVYGHMWLAGIGITGGGLIVTAASRFLASLGLPPLVGGAGIAGGAVAIVLAQFLVAYPIVFLVTATLLERHRALIAVAYDAGAQPIRVFFSVIGPVVRSPWLGALTLLAAFLLTHPAPTVFVDSPPWPQIGHAIALAAEHGHTPHVLVFSGIVFGVSLVGLALAVFVFGQFTRGSYYASKS